LRDFVGRRRAPTPPYARVDGHCASTCTFDGSHQRCCCRTSTARIPASSSTSSPSTPTSTPRWPPSRRGRSTPPSTPSPSPRVTCPPHARATRRAPHLDARHGPGTEWSDYYDELAAAFGLTIDLVGPVFGNEALLAEIADSAELATLAGERTRYLWPDSYDLRRIPVRDPAPIYPMSLIWHDDNPHPALSRLREHLRSSRVATPDEKVWMPNWAE